MVSILIYRIIKILKLSPTYILKAGKGQEEGGDRQQQQGSFRSYQVVHVLNQYARLSLIELVLRILFQV